MKKSKIIASFAGFALFTSSALALTSVSNGNTALIRNSSVLSAKEDLVDLKTIKGFDYGNSFANSYSSNIVIGINNLSNDWTNIALRCGGNTVSFNGYAQMNDSGRIVTDSTVGDKNWYTSIKGGTYSSNGSGFFGSLMDFNANEVAVTTSGDMQAMNMSEAYTFNQIMRSTNGSTPTAETTITTSDTSLQTPVYTSFDVGANQALSVGIKLHSYTTVVSEMRMATNGSDITDSAPKINTYTSSLSQFWDSTTKTEGATVTYANQNFGVASDGLDVFSGTTETINANNLVVNPITSLTGEEKRLSASEYLAKNRAKVAQAVSLKLKNAYPGTVYNSLSFATNDDKGTISVQFKPKSILVNGVARPYTGSAIVKEVVTGFTPSSFAFKQSNTKDAIVATSLSVVIPGVILIALIAIAIKLYEKQTAKYKEFEYKVD